MRKLVVLVTLGVLVVPTTASAADSRRAHMGGRRSCRDG